MAFIIPHSFFLVLTFRRTIRIIKERVFYLDGANNTGGHSLIGAYHSIRTKVKCENINKIVKEYEINKIKLDCEGAEDEILRVMDFTNIEEIVFEYHFNLA